jgi:hypothetical protein
MLLARKVIAISGLAIFAAITCPAYSVAQAPPAKMKDCLLIEDGYKERLDCYDAVIKPEPRAAAKKAKTASECRFLKEEDQRLSCYNGFVAPKQKAQALGKSSGSTKGSTKTLPPPK